MKSKYVRETDIILQISIVMLIIFGLIILFSASEYNGRVRFGDSAYYFKKQLFAVILGMIVMCVFSRIDYRIFVKIAPWTYVTALALSAVVLVVGKEINGSKRWLSFGPLSFQPSEFAKIAAILFLVWQIEKAEKKINSGWCMCWILITLFPIIGLVGTNNLSTAIIILGIGIVLIFVSNPKYFIFIGMGIAAIGFMTVFLLMESYRLERIAIWRDPESYEKGFQTIQGLYAIGSGGIFGRGLGASIQKLGFVPEAQNDMVFSIICEELGMWGAIFLICIFCILIWRLCVIATHCKCLQGTLICAGVMAHMAIQVILNIAVVTNTIPNTGITLPFISYGGTSVVFLLAEMGIVLSVSCGITEKTEYNMN